MLASDSEIYLSLLPGLLGLKACAATTTWLSLFLSFFFFFKDLFIYYM
jgi:hypothetical protein